jgi:membrane-associated phospholipid phosphatase
VGAREAAVRYRCVWVVAAAAALWASPASAQDAPSPWNVSYPLDGAFIGAFAGASVLLSTIEVDTSRRWEHELVPWDESVRGGYSDSAAARSDMFGALTVAGPMFAVLGSGLDESAAHRGVIYAESLSAGLFLNATAKYLVQRPRPYVYSSDPAVMRMAAGQSTESHVSFYSGHATVTFTAAVAGSYMFGVQSSNETSRAALWGMELAMASATANLRVRAGKHFWSDVVLGALVGAGIGVTVPRLHLDQPNRYSPTGTEYLAMGGGVAAGTLIAWVMPMSDDIRVGLGAKSLDVVPIALPGGAAMTVAGRW